MEKSLGCPDFPLLLFVLRNRRMQTGILLKKLPFHSLAEAVPQQLMDITDRARPDKLVLGLSGHRIVDRLRLQQLLIVLFQHSGREVLQLHVSDERRDIILDQADIGTVCRHCPGVLSVQSNVFLQEIVQSTALRDHKCADLLLILDFLLPGFRLSLCLKGFPLLFPVSLCVGIQIDDAEPAAALND